jgi:hypothetical protein
MRKALEYGLGDLFPVDRTLHRSSVLARSEPPLFPRGDSGTVGHVGSFAVAAPMKKTLFVTLVLSSCSNGT